jgi:hypothetical protein
MKKMITRKILAAGLALAALGLASAARGQTIVTFGGGNASQTILYDRVTNILTGGITSVTIAHTNSVVRTYIGNISGATGVNPVTINFSLLGAGQGLNDLASQSPETLATGGSTNLDVAVSSASPIVVGVDPTSFSDGVETLAIPYAFVKNAAKSPDLANVTNLTERQANYLEGASGYLPTAFFGGDSASAPIYLVARNSASAVRLEIDANIHFTGTISTWTTNSSGQPVQDTNSFGQGSGSAVRALLAALPNSIGTVAASDISTETALAFEGVPYSIANVENGSYPLWFYEKWFFSATKTLSANQSLVINSLLGSVTNASFQATNSVFTNYFVPLGSLQVSRPSDGGPIVSTIY